MSFHRAETEIDPDATPSIEALLRHHAWLRRLAASLVVDAAQADDVTQQTLLTALEHPPQDGRHPRAWLATVVRRLVRDAGTSARRREERERRAATPEGQLATDDVVAQAALHQEVSAAVLALAVAGELNVLPFPWERAMAISQNYALLAKMPRAPVAEFPFYGERVAFPLHAQYMVFSTAPWMPLINAYSDHIPDDFRAMVIHLSTFPSRSSFARLKPRRTRYVVFHLDLYDRRSREKVTARPRDGAPGASRSPAAPPRARRSGRCAGHRA